MSRQVTTSSLETIGFGLGVGTTAEVWIADAVRLVKGRIS
jgi:hypothetical protein